MIVRAAPGGPVEDAVVVVEEVLATHVIDVAVSVVVVAVDRIKRIGSDVCGKIGMIVLKTLVDDPDINVARTDVTGCPGLRCSRAALTRRGRA